MSTPSDRDRPDEEADLKDTADLVERHRVDAIEEARQRVREVRLRVKRGTDLGEITPASAQLQIARATKAYVRELEYPLASSEIGREYWENADLGVMKIAPPSPERLAWRHKERNSNATANSTRSHDHNQMPTGYELKREEDPDPLVVEIIGLREFLDTATIIEIEHGATFYVRFRGEKETSYTAEHPIPEHISTAAYRAANRFLGDIDLDIKATEDDEEWQI